MNRPSRLPLILTILGLVLSLQFSLSLAGPGPTTASAEPWIHIKVIETGPDAETVRVNVPLSLVEAMVPLMNHTWDGEDNAGDDDSDNDHGASRHHHHAIRINHHDLTPAEMHALLEAFRQAEGGEYVAVDGVDEKVRVTKSDGCFLVDVDDRGQDHEQVKVRIRMEVLEALLSGSTDTLNFSAAVRTLKNQTGEDLVTVTSADETVRIWIDEQKTAD
jgi:hypothetical protein